MSHYCAFCQAWHSAASCGHPANKASGGTKENPSFLGQAQFTPNYQEQLDRIESMLKQLLNDR